MSQKIYPVQKPVKSHALIDKAKYEKWYEESVENPDKFWGKHGKRIDWFKPYTKVKNTSFTGKVSIKWFEDGQTNVSYNCIDRHLKTNGNQVAIIFEGDNPYVDKKVTYNELYEHVCRMANVLKKHGVKKGDRVTIYMPMIPEAAYAMLACARIGAVHSVVFGGFSPEALAGRIVDCESTFVITCDEGVRGGKPVPLKENTDTAIHIAARQHVIVEKVLVVRRTGGKTGWAPGRDLWHHQEIATVKAECPPVKMKAEDPLFILYTSGSTGKPKGVLHTTAGYLVYASMTHEYVFDYHPGDIYWCTADVGWVTGHSYIVYGPLANCATTLMFEGVPNFPDQGRFWEIIDKHKVNIFYTAPTAIRSLMGAGDHFVTRSSPFFAPRARHCWRADQSGSLGVVPQCRRRQPLPGHRYLVADGNRRSHDYAATGCHRSQTRFGDDAVLRRKAGAGRQRRQGAGGCCGRQPVHFRQLAGPDADGLRRSRALHPDVLLHL
jgi:acetyl-CoA synthetase